MLWRWSAKEEPRSIETPHNPRFMAHPINNVVFSPDGALLAVNNPGSESYKGILIYDVASGQILQSMGPGGAVAFSPDGKSFSVTSIDDTRAKLAGGATIWGKSRQASWSSGFVDCSAARAFSRFRPMDNGSPRVVKWETTRCVFGT